MGKLFALVSLYKPAGMSQKMLCKVLQHAIGTVDFRPGMRIRFWPKNRIRGSVPKTKGDF